MKKIISKVKDGSVRFIVKTNRMLGFIPWFWHTDHFIYNLKTDTLCGRKMLSLTQKMKQEDTSRKIFII